MSLQNLEDLITEIGLCLFELLIFYLFLLILLVLLLERLRQMYKVKLITKLGKTDVYNIFDS